MAFSVSFYNISDPPNKLNKTIPETAAHVAQSASPYEPMSELTGKIILAYVPAADGCNYCSITEGSVTQYYFITDTVLLPGGKFEVYLKRDVLMTYESDIRSSPIYVTRAEQQATEDNPCGYNTYLPDAQIRKTAREFTIVKIDPYVPKFEYPDSAIPDARQYILGVIG